MRICRQCQCEMVEGFDVKVDSAGYGITIAAGTGFFADRIEKPKVAICPECGEISLYIDNVDKISKKRAKR
ncbi:MAG: nucleic acid-binding protein [Syntrophaceticus sp.]|nr:nucleic acid-binding protein [Syntrophaceticus sp.]MDD3315666.1 nucleic acid-binding protein [Syntrophaceticus sp.]MDD4360769.1 nucleic acid-binding protein [Syntrophaceticus sp.]MDD4783695.1 nucleic acid-binding protein [Syntrophaceticus sp.]